MHPTIYKFNKLRNHSEAVITTEISTPERYIHIFHATHIKINEGTFLRVRGKNRHRSSVTLGLLGCHLSPGEKDLTLPGNPPSLAQLQGGGGVGIVTGAEHEPGHCGFSRAKGLCGPPLLQAPNTSGSYQLSHNALSTHTQFKKNFPTLFYLECFKFLRKLVPFSFFFSFWLLFNVNLWVVGAERGLYLNSLDIHYHLTETLGKPAKP